MSRAWAAMCLTAGLAACLTIDERPKIRPGALGQAAGDGGSCGAITYQGCCANEVLYYCDSGAVLAMDCSKNPSCGWDAAASYYNCKTSGQPDPGGTYPKACAAVPDIGLSADTIDCGSVTYQGCCHGQVLHYCIDGELKSVDCAQSASTCSWDAKAAFYSCAGQGGADPGGTHPWACAFDAAAPVPDLGPQLLDGGLPDGAVPCGNVTYEGCCHEEVLYWCAADNTLHVIDCHQQPSCGWNATHAYYDCSTDGAADPSGAHPKSCVFGDAGPPVIAVGPPCGGVTWQGCCDGMTLYRCSAGVLKWYDCGAEPHCGWKTSGAAGYYACGTAGATDPDGQLPKACPFDAGVPDASMRDTSPACGPVTHQGCCEGQTLYYCASGTLNTLDCARSPSCGWQDAFGFYDCNTDGTADPLDAHPMACGFDGGVPVLDQGQPRDTAPPRDLSVHDIGQPAPAEDSGCGCALVPRSHGGVTLLLLLALVVSLRRRPG